MYGLVVWWFPAKNEIEWRTDIRFRVDCSSGYRLFKEAATDGRYSKGHNFGITVGRPDTLPAYVGKSLAIKLRHQVISGKLK